MIKRFRARLSERKLSKEDWFWLIFWVLACSLIIVFFPTDSTPVLSATDWQGNTMVREEVHRYFGYDPILLNYLTLPYDSNMNTHITGSFLDVGWWLWTFIPVILILLLKHRRSTLLWYVIFLSILLSISIACGHNIKFNADLGEIISNFQNYLSSSSFQNSPFQLAFHYISWLFIGLFQLINIIFGIEHWNMGLVSYPLLALLALIFLYFLLKALSEADPILKIISLFLFCYGFFWAILSSGIPWYGIVFVVMGVVMIIKFSGQLKKEKLWIKDGVAHLFTFSFVLWFFILIPYRMANFYPLKQDKTQHFVNADFLEYNSGLLSKLGVLDRYLPGAEKALTQMNQDDGIVYAVGTFFPYFIRGNNKRVFSDHVLGFFETLNNDYSEQRELTLAFKASGIKYLMIDLNTALMDKTPEQSLKQKFTKLLDFIYNNKGLKLLATDRIVNIGTAQNPQQRYGIFGDAVVFGNYAIYEIL